jgi:CubicO group peptidase (beta-lactamase class C family)
MSRFFSLVWIPVFLWQIPVVRSQKTLNFGSVDQKIQAWVDSGYYKGGNLVIGNRQKVLYQRSYGNYTAETSTYIASAGKWLAAATLAAVVEEGKLSWDDKVSQWLPEFKDAKGQATLRQLFSHTANYPDYQPKGKHRDDYQSLTESVRHILPLRSNDEVQMGNDELISQQKPKKKPKSVTRNSSLVIRKFQYGGLAMQVAGRMAEVATGKDWETLFQEKMARPLGMTHSHFVPVDSIGGGHSPMLGGGAVSSVEDYAHFLQLFLNKGIYNGKRILSEKSISELQADQVKDALVTAEGLGDYVKRTRGSSRKDIYGLGLWREEADAKGNPILISSPSWAGAYPWIDYKNGIYGFFLTHIEEGMMGKNGFSSFWNSPVLPMLVRDCFK